MVFGSSPANAAICLVPPRPSKADRRPPTHRCCRSSRRANTSATCSDQSPLATAVVAVMTEPSMGRSMALKTCRSIIYWVFSGNRNYTLPKYLDDSPKDVKKVVEAMEQKTRKRVSTKTIKRFIKKSHIWKRIKKSPAKSPEPQKYSRSQEMIARLQARESQGECALWYCDGAGFC